LEFLGKSGTAVDARRGARYYEVWFGAAIPDVLDRVLTAHAEWWASKINAAGLEPFMTTANTWIAVLQLKPHPEGGYYRETYRADEKIARDHLPSRFSGDRAFSTTIYFLLAGEDFSAFHRIKQDEVFHSYDGSSITLHVIDPAGNYSTVRVGRNLQAGEVPQAVMRAGCLFAATVNDPSSFALLGCTVAPGFDFADFEMPSKAELCERYPQHEPILKRLCR
jgi:predicted cupin superfamily sugar epimerase